ncbi:insulinase family protein [bacterium SCSIO 12741]|nr:insulinase family protein [bacterium SCSIO 12741]
MNKLIGFFSLFAAVLLTGCAETPKTEDSMNPLTATDGQGRTYEYVENDPMKVRIYTLPNGLKVYLTQNKNEPTIQTLIPVKAGSTYDPSDNTGLAHYLEHLMFKGTEKLGTQNWEEEKKLLDQISEQYELHKAENDPEKKKAIYHLIDSLSVEAAKYAVPNEYDKAISSIGGSYTNAFTSNERTVYMNTIPSNELEKWVRLERERFGSLVMRLFHTELETVYEEFNRGQDNDGRKVYQAMFKNLFTGHPYGEQTTIGEAEHLKNPSMVNIRNYFEQYYVPNNMAICLSGDFEFEETMALIEKYWSDLAKNDQLSHPSFDKIPEITEVKEVNIYGPEKENVSIAWRLGGAKTKDSEYGTILAELLSNGKAGLIDIDLVQKQQVLDAGAGVNFMKDYGFIRMIATLRDGQTKEEARDLLLAEMERVKKGDFDDKTFDAIINNLRRSAIEKRESNWRAFDLVESFVMDISWDEMVDYLDRLDQITKEDLIKFAQERFKDNYVVIYKQTGEDPGIIKVDKPEISKLELNKDVQSEYMAEFREIKSPELKPVFLDFQKDIKHATINSNIPFLYIENEDNELFKLIYTAEAGKKHNKKFSLAFEYLPYIGTSKYSAEELQKELYNLGLQFNAISGHERTYVIMSGLKKSTQAGIELMEHILADAKPDSMAYQMFVEGELKKRMDSKLDKRTIQGGAIPSYVKYGPDNPFTNVLSEEELRSINPSELTDLIHGLTSTEHEIFYYGEDSPETITGLIEASHPKLEALNPLAIETSFEEKESQNQVFFVHRDQVQADVIVISKGQDFDPKMVPMVNLYNTYYGSGLSSIIFQEIREAKGLAYTAYSRYTLPYDKKYSFFLNSYVGTQPDKLADALDALFGLLNEMPQVDIQLEESKHSIMKKIASDRRIKERKYFTYKTYQKLGIDHDMSKDIYEGVSKANMEMMAAFFDETVKGKNYTLVVMGNRKDVDMNILSKYGQVRELSLEELFGY